MTPTVELETHAFGDALVWQMVADIAIDRVRHDQIAVAMANEQAQRRVQRQQFPKIVRDARRHKAGPFVPLPFVANFLRKQRVSHLGLKAELIGRVTTNSPPSART